MPGKTFPNDEARREHFLNLLAEKLKDPEFRKQEGFPQGTDEAILAMSDPPYYTACPNPWLADFVGHYGKPYDPSVKYSREPLAIDVSVGKTDAIYKAHSYHTKVPHLAIVPSILHYTEPGDIVLDGFAGSGMTGVAAQWCGSAPATYRHELEMAWKQEGRPAPKWGARRAILNDLSPAATSIASTNNLPFDVNRFAYEADKLLADARQELGWMYQTKHKDGTPVHLSYTVWSEVFVCKSCSGETVFYEGAYDSAINKVRDEVTCSKCGAITKKENMDLLLESFMDSPYSRIEKRPKLVPVLIKYSLGRASYFKAPDSDDINIIEKISQLASPSGLPVDELPDCQMTRVGRMRTTNTRCIHHMYLARAAHTISYLWDKATQISDARLRGAIRYWLDSQFTNMSILNRYRPEVSFPYNPLSGVFYVPSLISEADPFTAYENKIKRLVKAFSISHAKNGVPAISSGSATMLPLPDGAVDYIFTDPPFGENIYYADLNILPESWYGVLTDASPEAIIDRVREKECLNISI